MTATTVHRPTRPSQPARPAWPRPLLTLDAAACVAIGLVLLAAPGWLADGLELTGAGGVRVVGGLFLVAAIANGLAARTGRTWHVLAAVDLDVVFLVVTGLVLAGGAGAPWARGLVVAGAVVTVAMALLKAASLRPAGGTRPSRR